MFDRLTRHGQSEYNVVERIGGDSGLTQKGDEFAHALADWVEAGTPLLLTPTAVNIELHSLLLTLNYTHCC
jgi:broad specificity phosphatase PhoE